jgi:Mn-dependent DtxR family transcriptional regulator
VIVGLIFVLVWFFSPKHGLAAAAIRRIRVQQDIIREDVLGLLWRLEERNQTSSSVSFELALCVSRRTLRIAMWNLRSSGSILRKDALWFLTEDGRKEASLVVRKHRLWETYLDKHFPQDHHQLHQSAERLEHVTTPEMQSKLGNPRKDPHGSIVPAQGDK